MNARPLWPNLGWLVGLLLVIACGMTGSSNWAHEPRSDNTLASARGKGFGARDEVVASPISLTAPDGTGLRLTRLDVQGVIDDPVSLTELHLEFENPRDEQLEGRFEITLPPGARVTRFAMKIGHEFQEGEVIEKQRARLTYETYLHRREDPALLEKDAGNQFRARVFPIAPRERKQLILSYTQSHADPDEPHRIPLVGLPWLEQLDVRVQVFGEDRAAPELVEMSKKRFRPVEDLSIRREGRAELALRSDGVLTARITPVTADQSTALQPVDTLAVLVDTSASRARDFEVQLQRVESLLAELAHASAEDPDVQVLAFDQTIEPVFTGKASDFAGRGVDALRARGALGASDIEAVLGRVADLGSVPRRVLLVGDAIPTAGETERQALAQQVAALEGAGVERLDVMLEGGVVDEAMARALSTALPKPGAVLDASTDAQDQVEALRHATVPAIDVKVPGADWVYPRRLEGLRPGESVLVHAGIGNQRKTELVLSGGVDSRQRLAVQGRESALLDRAGVAAEIGGLIARLEERPASADVHEHLRAQIVQLSTEHRILNEYTAMLVLENEAAYARFNIDRRSLSSILHVAELGVVEFDRSLPEVEPAPPPRPRPQERTEVARGKGGSISGVIKNNTSKEAIEGALVILQCNCLQGQRETMTNQNGLYRFANLPPGTYTIQALSGQADVSKVTTLPRGAKFRANFSLDPDNEFRRMIVVNPKPVRQDSSAGMRIDMDRARRGSRSRDRIRRRDRDISFTLPPEDRSISVEEAKNLPVGSSTSRDFTAVIDVAPTAQSDSAGISLAGTTGSESKYTVEGVNTSPRFGTVGSAALRRTTELPSVERTGLRVRGFASRGDVAQELSHHVRDIKQCYEQRLADNPRLTGRVRFELRIDEDGNVADALTPADNLDDPRVARCIAILARAWTFARPRGTEATIKVTYRFRPGDGPQEQRPASHKPKARPTTGVEGTLADVRKRIDRGRVDEAIEMADGWRGVAPDDVLALVALGEAYQAKGASRQASRAFGSIIDLHPSRADMRRFAGGYLDTLEGAGRALAIDSYEKAVKEREDHPAGHRMLAYALLRDGQYERAFEVLEAALARGFAPGRFAGLRKVLAADLGIVAAVWTANEPHARGKIMGRTAYNGVSVAREPSLRFVLTWESDANDMDLHIQDGYGNRAFYGHPQLDSGGELFADVTNGFGPECFEVDGQPRAFPYRIRADYFDRGAMGYGMGKVQVVQHDGEGNVAFEDLPFVVMSEHANVQLGTIRRPLLARGGTRLAD